MKVLFGERLLPYLHVIQNVLLDVIFHTIKIFKNPMPPYLVHTSDKPAASIFGTERQFSSEDKGTCLSKYMVSYCRTAVFYDVLFINTCFNNLEIKPDKMNVDTICPEVITSSK